MTDEPREAGRKRLLDMNASLMADLNARPEPVCGCGAYEGEEHTAVCKSLSDEPREPKPVRVERSEKWWLAKADAEGGMDVSVGGLPTFSYEHIVVCPDEHTQHVLAAVLDEVAWVQAHPGHIVVYDDYYRRTIQEIGTLMLRALRLNKEGA